VTDDEERDPDLERPRIPPRRTPPQPALPPRDHPQATTILVLGILGLIVCGLLSPFAWYMGTNALREIDRNPTVWGGRSVVNAGRICGIIGTVLILVGCCCGGLLLALGGAGSST
jgi:hypothetical protein